MRVFKACLIIIKRHYMSLLLYFVIFVALSIVLSKAFSISFSTDFEEIKPKFTIINRDVDSPLVVGLIEYLLGRGELVDLEDRKEILQDATFYHATEYILIFPEGFHNSFFSQKTVKPQTVKTTELAVGYYMDSLVQRYFSQVELRKIASPIIDEQAIIDTVLKDLSSRVEIQKRQFSEKEPINENYRVFMRVLPYIVMILVTLIVSNIMLAFTKPDVIMRNLSAPIKQRDIALEQILCYSIMSFIVFLILNITGFIQFGAKLQETDMRIICLILLNSFVFIVTATTMATLASSFVRGPNSQNAVANSLSLVLSFIGGVFVPQEILGEKLLSIAKFTPTYWYIKALDSICRVTSYDNESLSISLQAILIQLAFAVTFFSLTLAVSRYIGGSEKSFSSATTEFEA